jgi:signal peptidase I
MSIFSKNKESACGKEGKDAKMKCVIEYILEIVKVALISLAIVIPVRYFLIQPFYVKGASMEPNFLDYEYLIIDEISYRFNEPERGDIVVFKYPQDKGQYFIKRIVGLPNETVEIKDGKVIIYNVDNSSGAVLNEDYLDENVKTFGDRTVALGPDQYYILGDNRLASFDSRSFGPIERRHIVGKAWVRGWPFNKIKIFETPDYNF